MEMKPVVMGVSAALLVLAGIVVLQSGPVVVETTPNSHDIFTAQALTVKNALRTKLFAWRSRYREKPWLEFAHKGDLSIIDSVVEHVKAANASNTSAPSSFPPSTPCPTAPPTAPATSSPTVKPTQLPSVAPTEAKLNPKCTYCQDPSQFAKKRDYQGSDLIKGGVPVANAQACCKKCEGTKFCEYWTYGTSGKRKGTCWVKSSMQGNEPQDDRESGRLCIVSASPTSVSPTTAPSGLPSAVPSAWWGTLSPCTNAPVVPSSASDACAPLAPKKTCEAKAGCIWDASRCISAAGASNTSAPRLPWNWHNTLPWSPKKMGYDYNAHLGPPAA